MFYKKYCPKIENDLIYNKNRLEFINKINTNMLIYGNPGSGKKT